MPLFFIIAGVFHPKKSSVINIKKRVKGLVIPYFLWSTLLFGFWYFIGRKHGVSSELNLSVFKNFIGIFYAQGGVEYMDWGIPLWFLPALFLCFLIFHFIQKIKNKNVKIISLIALPSIGFIYPYFIDFHLIWSFDIALVASGFYAIGYYIRKKLLDVELKMAWLWILIFGFIHLITYDLNIKIDMYRAIYGNELLFFLHGLIGSFFYILLLKKLPTIPFLSLLGKMTIPILAMQIRALTFIKLILMLLFGFTFFNFTEFQKIAITIIQIALIIPIALIINKYIPVLNGGSKKI